MNIFDLHSDVLADYRDFVRSFLVIADERVRQFVHHALETEGRLWPDSGRRTTGERRLSWAAACRTLSARPRWNWEWIFRTSTWFTFGTCRPRQQTTPSGVAALDGRGSQV